MKKVIFVVIVVLITLFSTTSFAMASERLPNNEDISRMTEEQIKEKEEAFLEKVKEENKKAEEKGSGCSRPTSTSAILGLIGLGTLQICTKMRSRI